MKSSQPVPELPVSDVEKAQKYYQEQMGWKIEWLYPGKEVGAVSNGESVIFFRKTERRFEATVHWVYCSDVDSAFEYLTERGARIASKIEDKPWGLRQFTVHDLDGHIYYFHQD